MATDATGTPTSLGIPKFNVNADAPSGLGGNAQMDSIDALIKTLGISGLVANDVPVYDTVTGKFIKATGTPSSTTYLRGDGSWADPTSTTIVTGRVGSTGAVLAGTGWSASHTGAGAYTVTFTVAFSAAPLVLLTIANGGAQRIRSGTSSTNNFTVETFDGSGVASDANFNFIAQDVI